MKIILEINNNDTATYIYWNRTYVCFKNNSNGILTNTINANMCLFINLSHINYLTDHHEIVHTHFNGYYFRGTGK